VTRSSERPLQFVILRCLAILAGLSTLALRHHVSADLSPAWFKLLSSDGSRVIGSAHFEAEEGAKENLVIRGTYNFANGEYDIDEVWLDTRPTVPLPVLLRYRHSFFHADGSLDRASEADSTTGRASCSTYVNGKPQTVSEKLSFPADTYAGPAILLPIQDFLRRGSAGSAGFHDFHCAPGPKIYAISISVQPPGRWELYPGESLELDIQPDFGEFNIFVAPFVPKVRLWFDPARHFELVGAETARYYRGLPFIMVRKLRK
jgi:hypothetical protein